MSIDTLKSVREKIGRFPLTWTEQPVTSTSGLSKTGPHSTSAVSKRPLPLRCTHLSRCPALSSPPSSPRPLRGRRREREAVSLRQRALGRQKHTLTQPRGGDPESRESSNWYSELWGGGGEARTLTCTHRHAHTDMHTQTCTHRHAHAHTDMHTQTCTHRHAHTDMHTQTCTHRHAHTDMHTQTCTHRHAHTDMHTQTCTHRHVHTDMHMHTQTCTHRHAHTDMHTQTCTHRHAHTDMHTQTCTHRHAHTDMYTQTCTHRHAHTDMHTQTCTHRHAHTDMHTQTCTYRHAHTDMHTQTCTYRWDILGLNLLGPGSLDSGRRKVLPYSGVVAAGGVALPITGGNVHVRGSPAVKLLQTDLLPVLGGGARVGHAHWGGVCQR